MKAILKQAIAPPQVMPSPNTIIMIALVSIIYPLLRKLLLEEAIPAKARSLEAKIIANARQAKSTPQPKATIASVL